MFLFEWYSYKIYLFVAKMNLVTLLYQTLCTLIVWCVCVCWWMSERGWVWVLLFFPPHPSPPTLNDARTSLPILMCIIFEHVAFTVVTISHLCSHGWTLAFFCKIRQLLLDGWIFWELAGEGNLKMWMTSVIMPNRHNMCRWPAFTCDLSLLVWCTILVFG